MPERREYQMGDAKTDTPRRGGRGPGRLGMPAEKANDFRGSLYKLFMYCRRYLLAVIIALLLSFTGTLLNVIGPSQLSRITKIITAGLKSTIDVKAAMRVAAVLVMLYGLSFVFSICQGLIMATVTQLIVRNLRNEISHKINRLPLNYFDHTSTGDVLSRVTNDVDTISQSLSQSFITLVSSATLFVGSMVMMLVTNWIMALSGMLATFVGFGLMTAIISHSQKYFALQQSGLGAINGHIEETYAGHTIVKAYNGEDHVKETFDTLNRNLYESAWKSQFFSGVMGPLMGFIGNLGYVIICVVGALLTMNGVIGFEVIVAFMVYIRLFSQPLSQLAQAATSLQSTAAASERVFAFLEAQEMADESAKTTVLKNVKGDVVFDHVRFGYTPDKTIIHDFSADVAAGWKIAIVGPTGAGKTTMVNLLMRFYETDAGDILIDGTPIKALTRTNIHDLFCMVLQDTWLFEGTIKENIKYAKETATDDDVIRACQAVGLHHFIMTLPDGYDTVLSDQTNLSAGQRQLMTIARAMVENAPMLILDEATSSVDTRTEVLIQKAMDQLMKGRTSFVIAHRLSTIRNADIILVMKDGDILEKGTHHELMGRGGFYADLYNSQFESA